MSKILFSDLDGTLLCDDKSISQKNIRAVKALKNNGDYFAISTGRPIGTAKIVIDQMDLYDKGSFAISFNGALVYDCHNKAPIYESTISKPVIEEIFELSRNTGVYVQTYQDDVLLGIRDDENLRGYIGLTPMAYESGKDVLKFLKTSPYKAIFVSYNDPLAISRLKTDYGDFFLQRGLETVQSMDHYLEVIPKGISKAKGNKVLADYLGIDTKDTVAAGDERNDIPMIEASGIGVAMKNARDEVKAVADYITKNDNNNDGVAEIIEKYFFE